MKLSLQNLRVLLQERKTSNYKSEKFIFADALKTGHVILTDSYYYDKYTVRKQFILGLCVAINKDPWGMSFILRNVLGGCLIEQKFLIFDPLLYSIRISAERHFIDNKNKSKLYHIVQKPVLFRMNKNATSAKKFYKKTV
jgi:ribosomal protein L19